jgi:hypothetical protein
MLTLMIVVLVGLFFFLRVLIALSAEQKRRRKPAVTNLGSERFESPPLMERSARVLAFRARLSAATPLKQTGGSIASRHFQGN